MMKTIQTVMTAAMLMILLMPGPRGWAGGIVVEDGGHIQLSDQTIALECRDIVIQSGGSMDLGTGTVDLCRHFFLEPGSTLVDAAGAITLCGTWQNNSLFIQGPGSTIGFVAGCGVQNKATGSGDTDNDGVSDRQETIFDSDNDGLPDFLDDSISLVNWVMPVGIFQLLLE